MKRTQYTDERRFPFAADLLQNWVDPRGAYRVADWNDAPERTAEDVILALKRAAEES